MELDSPPSLTALYPKALAGTVLNLVPLIGGSGDSLPDEELVVSGVEVDRDHLAQYDRVCGFRFRDELPPTYPHMVGFPLQMRIMTARSFPFPAIGMVHVRNRIEQQRWLTADESLTVAVHAERLEKVKAGTEFDMVTEVSTGDEAVWRSVSTYLRRSGGGGGSSEKKSKSEPPRPEAIWKLGGDTGRRYAGVSGDRNPIHMHALTARLFGFPKPIAHGMWLKARCLAALEGELPAASAIDVSFKLPLLLPAKVGFSSRPDGAGRKFAVHDASSGKPHLEGAVQPA
jgi:hypothetical protein